MMRNVVIVGTGLIGTSIGLALRRAEFSGRIMGVDNNLAEGAEAVRLGAVDVACSLEDEALAACRAADVIVLAVPVLAILDWMKRLAPVLGPGQLVTDAGSTKLAIAESAGEGFGGAEQARFLPGHPMAGKESGGASLGDGALFDGAMWLFTPLGDDGDLERDWREWVGRFGCRTMDLDAAKHDLICAWVSHLPQMVATAMAAMFEDEFEAQPELAREFGAIGGRGLREMTRLGSSPYSMWRDVAMTNTPAIAATLFALEQRLAFVRENLRTPGLREEFAKANGFRDGMRKN